MQALEKNELKPWQQRQWCIPKVDWEFVARMEDVLELDAEADDRSLPVVCFDECPLQLVSEVRQPIPALPGQRRRYDYPYRREGTANLFIAFCPRQGWRHSTVTERRTKRDCALHGGGAFSSSAEGAAGSGQPKYPCRFRPLRDFRPHRSAPDSAAA